jgi:hypothetical protein
VRWREPAFEGGAAAVGAARNVTVEASADTAMYSIELLLPLTDNADKPFPPDMIASIRERLLRKFGGYTAFVRAPADGEWLAEGRRYRDDVLEVRVVTAELDRGWWRGFREDLERSLRQEEVLIHATRIERL